VSPQNPAAAQIIDTLIRKATAGVDPKFVAQQLIEKIPQQLSDELEEQDDIVEYLSHKFPAVRLHKAWFEALVAEIWETEQSPGPSPTMNDPNAGKPGPQQPTP
jgi:hypothetical protein